MTFPTFASKMPKATQRRHFDSDKSDCESSIRRTAQGPVGPDGVRAVDFNVQVVVVKIAGRSVRVVVSGHWQKIGWNGMTHVRTSKGLRRLTRREKRMTYQQWVNLHDGDLEALLSLRRPNGDRPLTWEQAVRLAKDLKVVLTPELKSRAFVRADVAEHLVQVCGEHDYPLWSMALLSMRYCKGKCYAIVDAGGQFAIIFGRQRYLAYGPNLIKNWTLSPSRIWGPKRAVRWLTA